MADIKSAREIAEEKISGLGEATEDERLKWKYVPEGERLTLRFLKEKLDLGVELGRYPEKARSYARSGAESVLLDNISLPKNEAVQARNNKAMEGVLALKKDKAAVNKILGQIKQILGHYADQGAEQRKRTYDALKQQYTTKLRQAVDKQLGLSVGAEEELEISVESLPQFQEEWRRTEAQLDGQYLKLLEEFKKELQRIA